VLDRIDTDYVVFVDNDVQVEEGWLDALVACADETGAGAVGPLYLIGDGAGPASIHMAGGRLTESRDGEGRTLQETHVLADADPREVAHKLVRAPCDFLEYHCMLIRSDLLRDGALLDPRIRCVHEHIDTAFAVQQRGYSSFFEPAARVTYLGFADYMLDDLPLFRARWSVGEAEASIGAFCRKWNVIDDDRSFGHVRYFVRVHTARSDPIRPSRLSEPDLRVPMRRDELRQTRSDLLDLARERGYEHEDLALIASAWPVAHVLMDGGYRPCGRPFSITSSEPQACSCGTTFAPISSPPGFCTPRTRIVLRIRADPPRRWRPCAQVSAAKAARWKHGCARMRSANRCSRPSRTSRLQRSASRTPRSSRWLRPMRSTCTSAASFDIRGGGTVSRPT
jgi:hypothetical protein